jgi:molecular chaperone GrpE
LADQSVVAIKAKGEKLDPHLHEAVAQEVTDAVEDGVIIDEVQRGYKLFDRVLRHARVKVATKPAVEKPKEE